MGRPLPRFLALASFLMVSLAAHAQTPKLVHSRSLSTARETGNNFRIQYGGPIGTGTLAGNLLTLRITYPHGSNVSAISDNKSSPYTLGATADSGSAGWVTSLYFVPGVSAGITQITVSFSASVTDWHGAVQEYSGVATSSPGTAPVRAAPRLLPTCSAVLRYRPERMET